jgi:histone H3/H4
MTDKLASPCIKRLARKAGVKNISSDCYDFIKQLIENEVDDIVRTMIDINNIKNTKTLLSPVLYTALQIKGVNVAQSSHLGESVLAKK